MSAENEDTLPDAGRDGAAHDGKPTLMHRLRRRVSRRSADTALEDVAVIEASGQFDKQWYLQRNPDVAESGMDPIQHYVRHGAAEGRDPSVGFSTPFYLRNNPDVAATGINPFRHYIEYGANESRKCRPTPSGDDRVTSGRPRSGRRDETTPQRDAEIIGGSKLFDTRYYLEKNPDVGASGMSPLVHFCRHGFKELRNPSREFDVAWYWLMYLPGDAVRNPLAHYLQEGLREGLRIRAVDALSDEDQQVLSEIATGLLEAKSTQPTALYERAGIALAHLKRWSAAETAFSMVLAREWSNARVHARLAKVLARQGKWWQAVESWSAATNLNSSRARWFFRLGEAQEKMNRFALAAEAYQQAIDRDPNHPDWYYLLGHMREKAGQLAFAKAAYAEARVRDPRKEVKLFGVGMFHQARGYWPEAAKAYAQELEDKPASAELHFKLGMALDRCYRWQEAAAAYQSAIALKPDTPYWHYRYGFVLERQEHFTKAAEAYAAGAMLDPQPKPYWWYRCGYAFAAGGEYEAACRAYLKTRTRQALSAEHGETLDAGLGDDRPSSWLNEYLGKFPSEELLSRALAHDMTDAGTHYQLGEARERHGDWCGAATAYANAVARANPYYPEWYFRRGFVLFRAGRFEEACRAFCETRILRRPFGVDVAKYAADATQNVLMEYAEYLETLPVVSRHILYESMHGASAGGNPRAIFECMVCDLRYADWTHIWVLAEGVRLPPGLAKRSNVISVQRNSDLYRRYLATASHMINDVTFPYWFIRRPEQKYLNTWHGTPLKKLGKHIPGEFMAHCNIQRNLLHATHVISPNPHTSDVLMGSYDVGGILPAKLAEVGYPRIDRSLRATPQRCADIRSELELHVGTPVVLYAPTWRGEHGNPRFDVERLREDVSAMAKLRCQVVFRGHHMLEKLMNDLDLPVVVAGQDVDTSDVLAITDILVTDYSSIFFDFLPLKRPILYYVYDERDYAKRRGLYFDIRTMPGTYCATRDALLEALARCLAHPKIDDGRYAEALALFSPHEDGEAAARSVAFFIENDDSHIVNRYADARRSLLFFNGLFPPNGITSSFLNLANALTAMGKDQITVAIEPERIANEPVWFEKLKQAPAITNFVGRVGHMVQSPEEHWVGERYGARRDLDAGLLWDVLQRAYKREFRRVFGDGLFDSVVNFEGYSAFWTTLFGLGAQGSRNVSYLHNDMVEEFRAKHPYLRAIFGAYRYYDRLVSVSRHMSEVNRRKLASEFELEASTFVSCVNSLDVEQVRRRARDPLDEDLQAWMNNGRCFLSIGRMSPEKGHAKLISAFAHVHSDCPDIRLIIMGDGPLRDVLKMQIMELGLQDAVFLAGLRQNPFPALALSSCFILASNHEGQPMVLLEAMTLGRPIIATDIDGNRGVLGTEYGMLVANNLEGLESGMRRFLNEGSSSCKFDADAYNSRAIIQFLQTVDSKQSSEPPHIARRSSAEIRSNHIVVAARADGLGERMNAILNGLYLAKRLGIDFAYNWSASGTWERTGADQTHHAIVPEEKFFSDDFISRYSLKKFDAKGFKEVAGKGLTASDLMAPMASESFKGWLAPRLALSEILCDDLAPSGTLNLQDAFEAIGFGPEVEEARNAARATELPSRCVAIHLRSGDIFYGPYRKFVHYSYKGITLPIAKAIVRKLRGSGESALLFGQDEDVLKYLKKETGAVLLEDVQRDRFDSPAAQAIFELVLMSRCTYIVAGSSGFAKQASWIGGIVVKQPRDIFGHLEQTRIAVADLAQHAEEYHPLQTAFAYWYAYYYGRQFKSPEVADELLEKASIYDPENQLYPMKRAFNFYRVGRLEQGEAIMSGLIKGEYGQRQAADLPAFDLLTAKTLSMFNLGEDFEAISSAARSGAPFAAACNYLVARAKKGGGLEELRIFDSCRGNDPVLEFLHKAWSISR